jgi:hypothetical protein
MSKIKLQPRTRVDPSVLDLYRTIAREKLESIQAKANTYNQSYRSNYLKGTASTIARLLPIAKGIKQEGKGIEYELNRMRGLGFDYITLMDGETGQYIAGFTREDMLIDQIDRNDKIVGRWEPGVYACCITVDGVTHNSMEAMHWIPERAPTAICRHFHHLAGGPRCTYFNHDEEAGLRLPPLKRKTQTCWGTFATPVSCALQDLDLAEMFRFMYIFVKKDYDGSRLVHPGSLPFLVRKP